MRVQRDIDSAKRRQVFGCGKVAHDVDSIFGNASFGKSFKNRAFQACLANANKSDATVRDPLKEDSPMMQEFRMDFVALIE